MGWFAPGRWRTVLDAAQEGYEAIDAMEVGMVAEDPGDAFQEHLVALVWPPDIVRERFFEFVLIFDAHEFVFLKETSRHRSVIGNLEPAACHRGKGSLGNLTRMSHEVALERI